MDLKDNRYERVEEVGPTQKEGELYRIRKIWDRRQKLSAFGASEFFFLGLE